MALSGNNDWQKLAQVLADGFQSLLKEVEHFSERERELDARLVYAFQEYVKLASDPVLDNYNSKEHETVARKIRQDIFPRRSVSKDSLPLSLPDPLNDNQDIRNGFEAYKIVKMRLQEKPTAVAQCPFSGRQTKSTALEQDFTIPGKEGNLSCPFARMAKQNNGVPTPPQDTFEDDPIAVEFHPELTSQSSVDVPPSATGTTSKCPIRYLDQHSPEEVAQYFENHKHEIPRSHEICVKRYQRNTQSIRELDSKYGNLVSMIQGLGVKHRQFLPREGGEHSVGGDPSSAGAVEKWADEVSHRSPQHDAQVDVLAEEGDGDVDDNEGERTGHFQRPLREIRVGESPSRPWGIHVPVTPEEPVTPAPALLEPLLATPRASPRPVPEDLQDQYLPKKCPFDHKSMKKEAKITESHEEPQGSRSQSTQPNLIFNGPVFFGYSPEQAAHLMSSMPSDFTKTRMP